MTVTLLQVDTTLTIAKPIIKPNKATILYQKWKEINQSARLRKILKKIKFRFLS